MPLRFARSMLPVLALIGLVGCDHATKAAAVEHLAAQATRHVLPGVDLLYTENHDVAFSLLRHVDLPARPVVLAVLPGLLTLLLLGRLVQRRRAPLRERLAYVLLAAGAVGNLLDRVARGFVVDFIHVHHWPVFNVADVLVVVGGALLGWELLRAERARRAERALERGTG